MAKHAPIHSVAIFLSDHLAGMRAALEFWRKMARVARITGTCSIAIPDFQAGRCLMTLNWCVLVPRHALWTFHRHELARYKMCIVLAVCKFGGTTVAIVEYSRERCEFFCTVSAFLGTVTQVNCTLVTMPLFVGVIKS
jgi:hypothetical protein